MLRRISGYVLAATGIVVCPCHLPLILPLVTTVLGGSMLGRFLHDNMILLVALLAAYSVAAMLLGVRLIRTRSDRRRIASCETCGDGGAQRRQWQEAQNNGEWTQSTWRG